MDVTSQLDAARHGLQLGASEASRNAAVYQWAERSVSSTIGEGLKRTGWRGTIDEGARQELLSEREDLPASTWLTQYHLFFCPTLCKFREKRLNVIILGLFKLTLRHESVQRWNGKMRAKEGGGRSRKRMRNKWQMRQDRWGIFSHLEGMDRHRVVAPPERSWP
ncbi:hypothetical protein B0H14DRAFT_2647883 [Mycena olivaceomarginata]|nr:hypothetical protein B0H14DRAFT_2647883 [Mycena olivaceomarginata]